MAGRIRAFVAVEIDDPIRRAAEAIVEELRPLSTAVKWVAADNWHITLKFLGDISLDKLEPIEEAMAAAVVGLPAFRLQIGGLGAFPNLRRPRTVWLGSVHDCQPIAELADLVERSLVPLGFARESRRFTPHITLGRVRDAARLPADLIARISRHAATAVGAIEVRHVTLFSSVLTSTGSIYSPLAKARLAG